MVGSEGQRAVVVVNAKGRSRDVRPGGLMYGGSIFIDATTLHRNILIERSNISKSYQIILEPASKL
jgi:hypothetical protein